MGTVTAWLGHILLGLVLLVQSGQTCACAFEHLLLCGGPAAAASGAAGDLALSDSGCGELACLAPDGCSRHSRHHTTCSARPEVKPVSSEMPSPRPAVLD